MYEAIKSFSGVISMSVGDVREINDVNIAKDLLRAGYIREIKPAVKGVKAKAEVKDEVKEEVKTESKAKTEKKPTRARAKKG